jgi:stage IV sporulation protein FB
VGVLSGALAGFPPQSRRCRLRVSPLYLLLLALWLGSGYFAEAVLLLVSLACHECAHLFVLAGFDVPVEAVELHPFGAVIIYGAPPEGLGATDALVAVAGPVQSFLLAAAGLYLQPLGWVNPQRLDLFIQCNLILACFNLLPLWPLDGGRVLRVWLAPRIGDQRAASALARAGRIAGALGVLVSAGVSVWVSKVLWVPALLGGFLWRAASRPTASGGETILRTVRKGRKAMPGGPGAGALLIARDDTGLGEILRRLRPDRYHLIVVIDPGGRKIGELTEDEFAAALIGLGLKGTAGAALRARPPA